MQDRIKTLLDFESAPDSALFDQKIISIIRDCSTATLERNRWAGGGIPFIKIGHKVRYRKGVVTEWLNSFESRQSTTN